MCLTLEANDLQIIKWWIDASSAVHGDMRSHTGGTMTLGKRSVCSSPIRQKLTTKSSTKAELVGVDAFLTPLQAAGDKLLVMGDIIAYLGDTTSGIQFCGFYRVPSRHSVIALNWKYLNRSWSKFKQEGKEC